MCRTPCNVSEVVFGQSAVVIQRSEDCFHLHRARSMSTNCSAELAILKRVPSQPSAADAACLPWQGPFLAPEKTQNTAAPRHKRIACNKCSCSPSMQPPHLLCGLLLTQRHRLLSHPGTAAASSPWLCVRLPGPLQASSSTTLSRAVVAEAGARLCSNAYCWQAACMGSLAATSAGSLLDSSLWCWCALCLTSLPPPARTPHTTVICRRMTASQWAMTGAARRSDFKLGAEPDNSSYERALLA